MTAPGGAKRLKDLSQRGRLIVIDPRRTETAQIANQHLFIRPGTDALFLAALLPHLQRLGPARIAHYRDRLDGLGTALAAINALPLDAVSAHTGLDPTALAGKNGRAACRERACQYVSVTVVAVSLNNKINLIKQ